MARPAAAEGASQIAGIQVLRGLAALSVAFLHIEQAAGAFVGRPGESPWPWLRALPWEAGVDVFFVISGFVMVYASARLFRSPGAVRGFLARRASRVVPLYWLFTTATLAVAAVAPRLLNDPVSGGWKMAVASYLFIPWQRQDGFVQPLFRLGWTLNYEMLFYVLFAPFLLLPRRIGSIGIMLVMAALVAAGQFLRPANVQLAFWTDPIVAEFAFGVAVGTARLESVRLPAAARAGLIALGVAALAFIGVDDTARRALSYGLPAACLVAGASLGSGRVGGSLTARTALLVGDASYALYLIHPFPMRGLREVWARLGLGNGGAAGILSYIVAAIVVSCVLAIGTHRWIELPLVRRIRRPRTTGSPGC
jgi:peptidoglycan/LPS O-acetylase OafA/YrhL